MRMIITSTSIRLLMLTELKYETVRIVPGTQRTGAQLDAVVGAVVITEL